MSFDLDEAVAWAKAFARPEDVIRVVDEYYGEFRVIQPATSQRRSGGEVRLRLDADRCLTIMLVAGPNRKFKWTIWPQDVRGRLIPANVQTRIQLADRAREHFHRYGTINQPRQPP